MQVQISQEVQQRRMYPDIYLGEYVEDRRHDEYGDGGVGGLEDVLRVVMSLELTVLGSG